MELTLEQVNRICLRKPSARAMANIKSLLLVVNLHGALYGLDQPHRLAHFLSQLAHESGDFIYDEEIASGAAYEGRKDLGNVKKGDGRKFKGRTELQCTGRENYRLFTIWVRKLIPDAPDFEEHPELINQDPYEGLAAIWFWSTKKLNRYADENNIMMVTRTINGGLNGFNSRVDYYVRAALVLTGRPLDLKAFQREAGLKLVDGVAGPQTLAALHKALVRLTDKPERAETVKAAPVVEKQAVPVVVPGADKPFWQSPEILAPAITVGGGGVTSLFSSADKLVGVAIIIAAVVLTVFLVIRHDRKQAAQAAAVNKINSEAL